MSFYRCPKCTSNKVSIERRPDGDAKCSLCGHKEGAKFFWVSQDKPKSELLEAVVDTEQCLRLENLDMVLKLNAELTALREENQKLQDKWEEGANTITDLEFENEKLRAQLKVAKEGLKTIYNDLYCHLPACSHRTRLVNASTCSPHRRVLQALAEIEKLEEKV